MPGATAAPDAAAQDGYAEVMPSRQSTAAAARAAITAAAAATKGLEAALRATADPTEGALVDGRKQRWQRHKEARRTELVDGTLAAVREHGADVGMDEIAAHIGVSKTVLYRYFTDKNDLNTAAMVRFIETVLLPRLTEVLVDDVDEYTLTRTVIWVYVETISDEPEIYQFVTSSKSASPSVLADSEKLIAEVVAFAMHARLGDRGLESDGFQTWAYALVGGVQLATHWWMQDQALPRAALVDQLTMLVWTSFVGIVEVGGSAAEFARREHPLPLFPSDAATPTD